MTLNVLTLSEIITGLKEKKFSFKEVHQDCLKQIKKYDPKIKSFISLNKSVGGIPYALKDIFVTKVLKTTAASNILKSFYSPYEATAVKRLRNNNFDFVGKTNLDSFCHGSSTETSDFFTTHNPWNLTRSAGGSSGGTAAAVTADMAIFGLGTETAGSIRQPSAWCGVTGLKPTYGRVSRYGVIAMASSLDSPGIIGKTAEDIAIILKIIAGKDPFDATSLPIAVPDYSQKLSANVKGIKIGIPTDYFLAKAQKGINETVYKGIEEFQKLGAIIVEIKLLDPKYAVAVYTILQRAEVSSNLARYDGIRFGNNRRNFNQENINRIMLGTYTLSAGYYDQYYLKAQKVRTLIINDFKKAFQGVDVIMAPSSPSTALKIGVSKNQAMFGEIQDILLEPASIAGLCALSLNCGYLENLPVGMQIIGPQLREDLILQVGYAYQQVTNWHKQKPKLE